LKELSEFELRRESRRRFHSIGAEAWNPLKPITILHLGSAKRPVLGDRRLKEECKELVGSEGWEVYWC